MTTRHVIRKDGWLYRQAYGRRKEEDRPTDTVNLCDTVWLAIGSFLGTVFLIALVCTFIVVVAAMAFFVLWGLWLVTPFLWSAIVEWLASPHSLTLSESARKGWTTVGLILGIVAFSATLVFGGRAVIKSEALRLFGAYLRAKKNKVCPIYKVV
jgi:hypothetical protein